jgi:hypothetical protein
MTRPPECLLPRHSCDLFGGRVVTGNFPLIINTEHPVVEAAENGLEPFFH